MWLPPTVAGARTVDPLVVKASPPQTPGTTVLKQHGVEFSHHLYEYEEHGGTRVSSRELGVEEYAVVKTLVMEDENNQPMVVLMHGTHKVSTKELARAAGVKRVSPCKPEAAHRHTGYLVGGISPFGTRKRLPVYVERSILELPKLLINGGRRGYLVGITPADLKKVLNPTPVQVGVPLDANE